MSVRRDEQSRDSARFVPGPGRQKVADVTPLNHGLRIKLANDGYAQPTLCPRPGTCRSGRSGATGVRPRSNRSIRLQQAAAQDDEIPLFYSDFLRLLSQRKFNSNVTMYDIRRSAVGFLFLTQDNMAMPSFWELIDALGAASVELEANTATMMERIASGKDLLGYNLLGSYAMARAQRDPALGVVLPRDYTLVLSRVLLIAKHAPHPNAAKLWLDFLLSRRGQTIIAERSRLFSIRPDVEGEFTASDHEEAGGTPACSIRARPAGSRPVEHRAL